MSITSALAMDPALLHLDHPFPQQKSAATVSLLDTIAAVKIAGGRCLITPRP